MIVGGIGFIDGTPTPVSVGAIVIGGNVTVTMLDVLGGNNSCEVLARVNVSNVEGAFEIGLTFPASTQPGTYALSDIGAVVNIVATDQSCADAYAGTTNDGTLWLNRNDTEVDGNLEAKFSVGSGTGEVLVQNLAAPICSSSRATSDGSCKLLGYCTTSASLSCWQLPN